MDSGTNAYGVGGSKEALASERALCERDSASLSKVTRIARAWRTSWLQTKLEVDTVGIRQLGSEEYASAVTCEAPVVPHIQARKSGKTPADDFKTTVFLYGLDICNSRSQYYPPKFIGAFWNEDLAIATRTLAPMLPCAVLSGPKRKFTG